MTSQEVATVSLQLPLLRFSAVPANELDAENQTSKSAKYC